MNAKHTADREFLRRIDGFFVGLLSPEEVAAFDRLCEAGEARRVYTGAGGFMGLAKVELRLAKAAQE